MNLSNTPLAGIIRTALASVAGIAIAFGFIDEGSANVAIDAIVGIVGSVTALIVAYHSIKSKLEAQKK